MRVVDSDILSYALYDESPAHELAWRLVERGVLGEIDLHITPITVLETYNVLYHFYRVRPLTRLLEKLTLVVESLKVIDASMEGLGIAARENIPLGDGFLIATALKHRMPVVVTNDAHILGKASKYGLIAENPITEEVRGKLSSWKID